MATSGHRIPKKRLVLRIPEDFYNKIKELASQEHRSVNNYVEIILRKALDN